MDTAVSGENKNCIFVRKTVEKSERVDKKHDFDIIFFNTPL